VLGEPQILGQVKDAFELSSSYLSPTKTFDQVIRTALKVGRKARASTEIGAGAVSVASAAVHLSKRIFSDLSHRTVLVVGAGETGRLLAEHFSNHHPARIVIANRTTKKGEDVARAVGGESIELHRVPELLAEADVVATAIQTETPFLTKNMLAPSLAQRSGRPLALLDVGLPRNIDPSIDSVPNVFLNDIEALKHVVDANLARRRQDVPRVETFIHSEIDRLSDWHHSQRIGPVIANFRDSVESLRRSEVDKVSRGLNDDERNAVEHATRSVVNKLLHGPMTFLKEPEQVPAATERVELLRHVFQNLNLDEQAEEEATEATPPSSEEKQ
jgi:glutamyl-tRNA reductase